MKLKVITGIMLTLLLMSMLTLAFYIKPPKAVWTLTETVYIRADGSIDPPTAPISTVDNTTYILTENITVENLDIDNAIIVERDNIVIDGAGYSVQGGNWIGLNLTGRSNMITKNMEILGFYNCMYLSSSSNITISGNNINADDWAGASIRIVDLSNSNISGNNINAEDGIWVNRYLNNTVISGNNIYSFYGRGIIVSSSNNNTISSNRIHSHYSSIKLSSSSNTSISDNNMTGGSESGVHLGSGSINTISGNIIPGESSVRLTSSSINTISENTVESWIEFTSSSFNNISGNTIGGETGIYLTSSSFNNVFDNNITGFRQKGINLQSSSNNNTVFRNTITASASAHEESSSVSLSSSSDNKFYHNNFISDFQQVDIENSTNLWDDSYVSGGNYWSDYTGIDVKSGPLQNETGSDGRGDSPYIINENNTDHYPLMRPWPQIRIPAASFVHTPLPVVGEPVFFDASVSYDVDGQIVSYNWDFGDGNTTTIPSPTIDHVYPTFGSYNVSLTVVDNDGLNDTIVKSINVVKFVWIVDDDGPADFSTIQEAVDIASDGDTILVRAGTYYEYVNINKPLTLIGEKQSTVLDGNGTGTIITISSYNCTISDFKIRNGERGVFIGPWQRWFDQLKLINATIENTTIQNCGTGIYLGDSATPSIYGPWNTTIFNNLIKNCGTGIYILGAENFYIASNSFIENSDATASSGSRYGYYSGKLYRNLFYNNSRGLSLPTTFGSKISIENNLIYLCGEYGLDLGPWAEDSAIYDVIGNHIWNNEYGIKLAGFQISGIVQNNTMENNDYGFSLLGVHIAAITVYHNNFVNNGIQAFCTQGTPDHGQIDWDAGYPIGGNYWSDYEEMDLYNGAFQNITGPDGFGDIPYVIKELNQDNYPLMELIPITFPPAPLPLSPYASFIHTSPLVTKPVTFDASFSQDLDGTVVSYEWDFGDGNATTVSGPMISHVYSTVDTYDVTLTVVDNDGLTDTVMEYVNVEKLVSTISVSMSPPTITIFENTTINGSITPTREGANVTIWHRFGAGDWAILTNVTSDQNSEFSYLWTPSEPEIYELKANWTGDNYTLPAESSTVTLTCLKVVTHISISTSSTTTYVGFKVNITGTLMDEYGNELKDETVVLYYTFSGIGTWTPITSDTTDNFGKYSATWIPTATGYFELKVEWAGNTTYFAASNTTTLSSLVYQDQYVFSVESNSTISELALDTKNWKLSFVATGPDGTRGYVKVTIAKSLVANVTNIRVFLDGRQPTYSIISLDDSWLLTFSYAHSTHEVEIDLGVVTDTTPPTILVLSPENKTYPASDIPLTFTASESTSWIGYSLDGQMNLTISGNTTIVGLSEGTHTIAVYANDTIGNMGYSYTVYFTIDTTSPNVEILSPQNKTYTTSSIPLSFTFDEATSWIGYSLDGQANITIAGNTTLAELSDGMHNLVVYAKDIPGNTGSSNIVHFTIQTTPIDTTAPIADAGPNQAANVGTLVTFDASGSTDNVGIASCEWDFGDGTTDTGITCDHTYTEPGNYTATLTVKDAAGNLATDTIIVTVIEEAPAPFPWWILGLLAGVIVGIVAVTILWRRRK